MSTAEEPEGPLGEVTIIDLNRALAGPQRTPLLVDPGARVTKAETGSEDPTRQWPPFGEEPSPHLDTIGRPELADDPRSAEPRDRSVHRQDLDEQFREALTMESADPWVVLFQATGTPTGPILDYPQLVESERARVLGMAVPVERADGTQLQVLQDPKRIDGTPTLIRSAPSSSSGQVHPTLPGSNFKDTDLDRLVSVGTVGAP